MQSNKVSLIDKLVIVNPRHPKSSTDNYVFIVPVCIYEISAIFKILVKRAA